MTDPFLDDRPLSITPLINDPERQIALKRPKPPQIPQIITQGAVFQGGFLNFCPTKGRREIGVFGK
jgi:hypothetical protein